MSLCITEINYSYRVKQSFSNVRDLCAFCRFPTVAVLKRQKNLTLCDMCQKVVYGEPTNNVVVQRTN